MNMTFSLFQYDDQYLDLNVYEKSHMQINSKFQS